MPTEDTILEVGTIVDTGPLVTGMREAASTVESTTTAMAGGFQQLASASATAAATLGETIPVAAVAAGEAVETSIPPAAAATSESINQMGAASEGFLARFKAAMAGAAASLDGFRERVIITGSSVRASMNETVGSFGGLGAVLGIVLGAEIFEHFINKTVETTVHLGHMADAIGVNIDELNGLRLALDSQGVSFDRASIGFTRLIRGAQEAIEGSKQYVDAFQRIGVSTEQLRGLKPDEIIYRTADAFKEAASSGDRAASAFTLLGRGGYSLIGPLSEGGEQLRKMVEHFQSLSPSMRQAYEAAIQYRQQQAELSAQWQQIAIPVMEVVVKLVQVLRTAFEGLALAMEGISAVVATVFLGLATAMEDFAALFLPIVINIKDTVGPIFKAIADGMRGDLHAAYEDIKSIPSKMASDWQHSIDNLVRDNKRFPDDVKRVWGNLASDASKTYAEIQDIWKKPIVPPEMEAPLEGSDVSQAKSRIAAWEDELNQRKMALDAYHTISSADEMAFWEDIKNTHKLTDEEEQSIDRKLVELRKTLGRQDVEAMIQDERTKVASTRQGTAERLELETELLNKLKALATGGAGAVEPDLEGKIREQEARVAAVQRDMSEKEKQLAMETALAKVAATRQGTEARIAEEQRYVALVQTLYGRESTQFEEAQRRLNADVVRYQQERLAIAQQEVKTSEELAILRVQNEEKIMEARVPAFAKNSGAVLAQEEQFAAREYEIRREALEREIALAEQDPNNSPAKTAALKAQLLVIEQQYYNQRNAIAAQSANYRKQLEENLVSSFESSFASGLSGLITGTMTLQKAWINLTRSMLDSFLQTLTKMVTQWIVEHTIMRVFHQTFLSQKQLSDSVATTQDIATQQSADLQKITSTVTSNAVREGSTAAMYGGLDMLYTQDMAAVTVAESAKNREISTVNIGNVTSEAALAAAKAYAAYAENPPVAAAMAAEAEAQVLSYLPEAAMAEGGRVEGPGTGTSDSIIARLSAGEYVVRADVVRQLGTPFMDALNKGAFAQGGTVMSGMGVPAAALAAGGVVPALAMAAGGTVVAPTVSPSFYATGGMAVARFAAGGITVAPAHVTASFTSGGMAMPAYVHGGAVPVYAKGGQAGASGAPAYAQGGHVLARFAGGGTVIASTYARGGAVPVVARFAGGGVVVAPASVTAHFAAGGPVLAKFSTGGAVLGKFAAGGSVVSSTTTLAPPAAVMTSVAGPSSISSSAVTNNSNEHNYNLAYHAPSGARTAPSHDARQFADLLKKELRRQNLLPG